MERVVIDSGMGVTRKVKPGVIVLQPGTKLPEGADLKVQSFDLPPESDPCIAEVLKLAKPRPHWPKAFALNHARYAEDRPKKA
jgi:hypothetical protein